MNSAAAFFEITHTHPVSRSPLLGKHRSAHRASLLLILGLLLAPLLLICLNLPFAGGSALWPHIRSTMLSRYVVNTLTVSISVTLLSTLIGVSAAWFITRYRFPLRGFLEWFFIFPKAIPAYIAAYSYQGMFSYTGFGNRLITSIFPGNGLQISGIPGLILVLSLVLYPYVYLVSRAAFSLQSASLVEASQSFPGKKKKLLFGVALPLAKPAILAGAMLVFMESLNEYGATLYLGVDTLTTGIFRAWFLYYDLPLSRMLSFLLLCIACVVMIFVHRHHPRFQLSSLQRPIRRCRASLLRSCGIYFVFFAPILLGFVLPVLQLCYWSFFELTPLKEVIPLLLQSFFIAGIAAFLCVSVSLLLSLHPRIFQNKNPSHCAFALSIGYSVPGAVIAVGILGIVSLLSGLFPTMSSGLKNMLLNTSFLALLYGYLIRYVTISFMPFHSTFASRCRGFHEASCALGKNRMHTLFSVHLPLMRRTIITTALLVFIDILKDLPITVMLRPFNFDTLAIRVHELVETERIGEAAFPALILIMMGLIPVFFLSRMETLHPCRRK